MVPEPNQEVATWGLMSVCPGIGRPNVEDDIKNDLFPDPPSGAHPKFRCDTLGTALVFVWGGFRDDWSSSCRTHVWPPGLVLGKRPIACHAERAPLAHQRCGQAAVRGRVDGPSGRGTALPVALLPGCGACGRPRLGRPGVRAPVRFAYPLALQLVHVCHRRSTQVVSGGAAHTRGRWWRNLFLAQVYAPAAEARQDPLLAIDYHGRLFQARQAPRRACQGYVVALCAWPCLLGQAKPAS